MYGYFCEICYKEHQMNSKIGKEHYPEYLRINKIKDQEAEDRGKNEKPMSKEEVDQRLQRIMTDIHEACVTYGKDETGFVDYVKGANIAGFVKVADAMLAQGVV